MKRSVVNRCLDMLFHDWDGNKHRPNYHYAFAIRKNKILEVGRNKPDWQDVKALYLARSFGIEKWENYPYLHAESDLIIKLDDKYKNHKTEILSIRINRHGRFKLAKPCINCQKMLDGIGITKIVWSCNLDDYSSNDLILKSQEKILAEKVEKIRLQKPCQTFWPGKT